MSANKNILVIPDLHYPFAHKDHMDFLKEVTKAHKPNTYVCLGDEVDNHAISNFDSDPDGYSAGHELDVARADLDKLFKAYPNMYVCESNHGSRFFRRAYKFGIPKDSLKNYNEIYKAPKGWQWAEKFEIDGIIFEHGEPHTGRNAAITAAMQNMQSTVIGHVHSFAGIQYYANPKFLIFGFNAGCLIDKDTYAFSYGKKLKSKPILGCGVINKGVPTFVPMLLDKHGRWIGEL